MGNQTSKISLGYYDRNLFSIYDSYISLGNLRRTDVFG